MAYTDAVPTIAEIYQARKGIYDVTKFTFDPGLTFVDSDNKTKLTLNGLINDIGFINAGTFAAGVTITRKNELVMDAAGLLWQWQGTFPRIVTAGTVPSTPTWVQLVTTSVQSLTGLTQPSGLDAIYARNVNSIKSMGFTPTFDGHTVIPRGFYNNTTVGGGDFVWNSSMSKTSHNGGTIIAPEAIIAWDGSAVNIATLLNWTGTGSGCWVKEVYGDYIDLSHFGGVYGGVADCSDSLEKMQNLNVLISGAVKLNREVTLFNNLKCANGGHFVYLSSQTNKLLKFTTKQPPRLVNPLTVTGLTELSDTVGGFGAVKSGGWAWIDSDETLILRSIGGGRYTKQEIIVFDGVNGGLSVVVEETYDLAQINKIEYYDPEPTVYADVAVKGDNLSDVYVEGLLTFERRNFDIKVNADVKNTGYNVTATVLPFVKFDTPIISAQTTGLGYGIHSFIVGGVAISNPQISNCRHGYSGRHDKNVIISGTGWISRDIDSHYGYNFLVTGGVTLVGNVSFAGRDIKVTGINHYADDFGIQVRIDTPEIKGVMAYDINNVFLDTTADWSALALGLGNSTFFDFGRALKSPSRMSAQRNTFHIKSVGTNFRYCWQRQPQNYLREACKLIEVGGNTFTKITPGYIQGLADFTKSVRISTTYNTLVKIHNEERIANNVDDGYLGSNFVYGFKFDFQNIANLANSIDSGALLDSVIRNSHVTLLRHQTAGLLPLANTMGNWNLEGCSFPTSTFAVANNQMYLCAGSFNIELMPDNSVLQWLFTGGNRIGKVTIIRQSDADRSGEFTYDTTSPTVSKMMKIGGGVAIKTLDNASLTGATGVAGDVTVSCNSNKLYIENRSGIVNFKVKIDSF